MIRVIRGQSKEVQREKSIGRKVCDIMHNKAMSEHVFRKGDEISVKATSVHRKASSMRSIEQRDVVVRRGW